jgi:phosphoenolpyruvate carboxykinase (ATP)
MGIIPPPDARGAARHFEKREGCKYTLSLGRTRAPVGVTMAKGPYDPDVYRHFAENLRSSLDGPNIEHISLRKLRRKALETARITAGGSPMWFSKVSSRMAAKTVYLGGGPEIVLPRASKMQLDLVEKAPEQLHKVLQLLRTMPFVHVRRQMGDNKEFNPVCNLYVCVADKKNYRLASSGR